MPTSVDHYVTTNSLEAGWISQLAVLTLDLQRSGRPVSHLLFKSTIIPMCWQLDIQNTPDTRSLSQARFQRKSADEYQTFHAIFDLWIKVIDAEFYGMEEVPCMEYLLRLCVALPVRIWMSHYTATPTPHPMFNSSSGQTPQSNAGTSPSAPFRAISPNYDCPHPEFTHRQTHVKQHLSKQAYTQTHAVRDLMVRCPRQHSPV